mmetsp:Transcript_5816/g.18656  ORF Transcript_5816/g.18656 Transcript_5816/m.18656 type:complete len:257 (+) Transcript_5816:319-1089(+)
MSVYASSVSPPSSLWTRAARRARALGRPRSVSAERTNAGTRGSRCPRACSYSLAPSKFGGRTSCPPGCGSRAARRAGMPPVPGHPVRPAMECRFHDALSRSSPACTRGVATDEKACTSCASFLSRRSFSSIKLMRRRKCTNTRMFTSRLKRSTGVLRVDGTKRCAARPPARPALRASSRQTKAATYHSRPLSVTIWSGSASAARKGATNSSYTVTGSLFISAVSECTKRVRPSIATATKMRYSCSLHAKSMCVEYM